MFIGKFRRGQVRGIDFSLAMIIFLLTMSQVLVLTTTFIENSQSSQEVSSNIATNQAYATEFKTRSGSYQGTINWGEQTTTNLQDNGWSFGLSNGNGSLDPVKMGRLSSSNLDTYNLSYTDIEAASDADIDFQIQFKSTIDIQITPISAPNPDYTVSGRVTQDLDGLEDAQVSIFVFDLTTGSQPTDFYTRSNQTGYFSQTFTDTGNTYLVVTMAKYGVGNEDMAYQVVGPNSNISNSPQTVLRGTSGTGNTLSVTPSFILDDQHAIFNGIGQNMTNYDSVSSEIGVPEKGLVIIVSIETSTTPQFALSTYPVILDGDLSNTVSPSNPGGQSSSVSETIVLVRGILMKYSFKSWS